MKLFLSLALVLVLCGSADANPFGGRFAGPRPTPRGFSRGGFLRGSFGGFQRGGSLFDLRLRVGARPSWYNYGGYNYGGYDYGGYERPLVLRDRFGRLVVIYRYGY